MCEPCSILLTQVEGDIATFATTLIGETFAIFANFRPFRESLSCEFFLKLQFAKVYPVIFFVIFSLKKVKFLD